MESTTQPIIIKEPLLHTVLFWLKNPDKDRATFQMALKSFIKKSKYAKLIHVGTPIKTDRAVVDTSYTFALIVSFDSQEALDNYQNEPIHQTFITKSSNLWKKVVVYDSVNIL